MKKSRLTRRYGLPAVCRGVIDVFARDVVRRAEENKEYFPVDEYCSEMGKENPNLLRVLMSFGEKHEKKYGSNMAMAFIAGCAITYELLRRQAEINEMEQITDENAD